MDETNKKERLLMLLKCFRALMEGFQISTEDQRPIGLRSFDEFSDDELLAQLSRPTSPIPKFKTSFNKRVLKTPTPAFVHVQSSPFRDNAQQFYGGASLQRR